MKKALSIILALTMILSMTTFVGAAENPFVDVPSDAWYHDEVVEAVETGIISGKNATEFKPDDLLTYAEAVKLAACMHQRYTEGKVTLTNGDPWYKSYADYCRENKITKKDYDYSENATRAGYMEIFAKALPEEALEVINDIEEDSIPDVPSSEAYADGVYLLYGAGIVTGVDEKHNCNPTANIKRAEVAVIVHRMMVPEKRVRFDLKSVYGSIIDNNDIDIGGHESVEIVIPDGSQMTDKDSTSDIDYGNPSVEIKIPGEREVIAPDKDETDDDTDDTQLPDNQETSKPIISNDGNITFTPVSNTTQTIYTAFTIVKQPKNYEADKYGIKTELEVEVKGGKEPYSYQWFYYTGYRNNKDKIVSGAYVKDVTSDALVLSIEKGNTLLGQQIYCEITDAEGTKVRTDTVKVYGPFSMAVDESLSDSGKYTLVGRVADGILKKGEKVSVIRNGKVIAIGTATDLQMFNKSMDETVKGDNIGIVFDRENGVRPVGGDIVVKYQPSHVIDTSDIVN